MVAIRMRGFGMLVAVLALAASACAHRGPGGVSGGSVGAQSGTGVGYVNMDAVIAAHPLNAQLQSMQDQISVLQQEAAVVPTGMSPAQASAYDAMQRELATAADKFQQDLGQRRAYYERREAEAIGRLQAAALGQNPNSTTILGGLQQQYSQQ